MLHYLPLIQVFESVLIVNIDNRLSQNSPSLIILIYRSKILP